MIMPREKKEIQKEPLKEEGFVCAVEMLFKINLTDKKIKESQLCKPINYYGHSKHEGEKYIVNSNCKYIILRLSWLYGKYGKSYGNGRNLCVS